MAWWPESLRRRTHKNTIAKWWIRDIFYFRGLLGLFPWHSLTSSLQKLFCLLHLVRRRCEECLLELKQEFRLSEFCSSKLRSSQPLELPFCTRYSGMLISWDVGRASLARRPLEQHGLPSSCSEKLQELGAAWFGHGVQIWEDFFHLSCVWPG